MASSAAAECGGSHPHIIYLRPGAASIPWMAYGDGTEFPRNCDVGAGSCNPWKVMGECRRVQRTAILEADPHLR